MSRKPEGGGPITPVGLGLRAVRGGAVVVGVVLDANQPRVVLSSFLHTADGQDRFSLGPYHMAAAISPGGTPTAEAKAIIVEGRKRQDALAAKGLAELVRKLRSAKNEPAVAALLVNRAGWVTDLLAYSLAFAEHVPVAEGLAVREALRFAIKRAGLTIAEMDEKSLPGLACETFRIARQELDTSLKQLGTAAGRPWRKEQKLAAVAAWVALAAVS